MFSFKLYTLFIAASKLDTCRSSTKIFQSKHIKHHEWQLRVRTSIVVTNNMLPIPLLNEYIVSIKGARILRRL